MMVSRSNAKVAKPANSQAGMISLKNFEKLVVYLAALVSATNGFGQLPIPNGVRATIVAIAGAVLAAIHVSTPAPPSEVVNK